jgi:hypothetical protein
MSSIGFFFGMSLIFSGIILVIISLQHMYDEFIYPRGFRNRKMKIPGTIFHSPV